MSKVLVTGAGGYIGSHAVEDLARRGYQVTGTWRHNRSRLDEAGRAGVSVAQIDLADSLEVERLMTTGKFDAVVHAAATVDAANSPDNLRASIDDNVQAHSNLVSAALKAGCRRFLFCSTISVYGGAGAGPSGYLEQDARPVSIYGWSKYAAEQVLDLASGVVANFSCVSLRLAGVHGRGRNDGALHAISSAALADRAITLKDPTSRFRWLLIDDLLTAINSLLRAPLPTGHHVCNLASADTFTLIEVAKRVKDLCGSSSPIETTGSAVRNEVMNIDRAIDLWGFVPTKLDAFLPGYLGSFAVKA